MAKYFPNGGKRNRTDASTTYAGRLSDDGNLIKVGTGTLTLTGNNTATGNLTVGAGTLPEPGYLGMAEHWREWSAVCGARRTAA